MTVLLYVCVYFWKLCTCLGYSSTATRVVRSVPKKKRVVNQKIEPKISPRSPESILDEMTADEGLRAQGEALIASITRLHTLTQHPHSTQPTHTSMQALSGVQLSMYVHDLQVHVKKCIGEVGRVLDLFEGEVAKAHAAECEARNLYEGMSKRGQLLLNEMVMAEREILKLREEEVAEIVKQRELGVHDSEVLGEIGPLETQLCSAPRYDQRASIKTGIVEAEKMIEKVVFTIQL